MFHNHHLPYGMASEWSGAERRGMERCGKVWTWTWQDRTIWHGLNFFIFIFILGLAWTGEVMYVGFRRVQAW